MAVQVNAVHTENSPARNAAFGATWSKHATWSKNVGRAFKTDLCARK